jgi:effector-binding domain-containing protein
MRKLCCVLVLLALAAFLGSAAWAQTAGTNAGVPVDTSAAQLKISKEVELRTDTAFAYCALEMTGSYDQHSAAFEKLYAEAMKQGIYGGTPFGVYWNSPGDTPVEKLAWDVGFIVPSSQTPKEPLKLKKWEFPTAAVLEYRGAFAGEGMTNAYNAIFKWIGEHGYKPAGPMMETFLNIPSPNEQGVLVGSVEIAVPVEKVPEAKDTKAK